MFDKLFLSAGAMKAGTTWLYSVLERHPALYFTPEKEIHYFYHKFVDPDLLSERKRLENARNRYIDRINPERNNIQRVRQNLHWVTNYLDGPLDDIWYRNLFALRRSETYCCDFSNLYALLPEPAWERILRDTDTLRVCYTLRDPVKRLWSHVKFHLQISGQIDRLDTWGPQDFAAFVRKPFIWQNAEYGANLARMMSVLPDHALKVMFFEDHRRDPAGVIAGIEDFLGIARHDYPAHLLAQKVNASVSRKMPDFFPGLIVEDIARIVEELAALGVVAPADWMRPDRAATAA